MGNNVFAFTDQELNVLKSLYEASSSTSVNWVRAVLAFPAETDWEKEWKARMIAGIRLVETMVSTDSQTAQ